jgi:hypothetical protein
VGLKLNGSPQVVVYADDVNLLVHNTNTIKINTKALIDASKGVRLEVNMEKTKYIVMSTNMQGTILTIKVANRAFENVLKFKYTGTTVPDKSWKLRADYIHVMLATFCLLVCFQKKEELKYTNL